MIGVDRAGKGVLLASLLVFVALGAATGTAASQSAPDCSTVTYDGDGTDTSPYEVGNVDQLQCIEEQGLNANYVQVSDIDASETISWNNGKGFNPIDIPPGSSGTTFSGFTGTFDGQDHKITDLTIDRWSDGGFAGLFGAVGSRGKVMNVSVVDANITGLGFGVGGLAGVSKGTVAESYATGSVNGSLGHVGGLVGGNNGTIERSHAKVEVDGPSSVGGLVGANFGTVTESYAAGAVNGTLAQVGGLIGSNDGGTVTKSYATAGVDGSELVGGLVGGNGFGSGPLGNGRGGEVTESYATGSVNGTRIVGGLVGGNNGTVDESYAVGAVNGSVRYAVGGLVVLNEGTVEESYWDVNETGQPMSAGNGTGLNTSEMTGSAARGNMTGFDFTSTWETVSGDYPMFAWQTDSRDEMGEGGEDEVSDSTDGNRENEGLPGFTTVTALLALLTVVATAVRRRTE